MDPLNNFHQSLWSSLTGENNQGTDRAEESSRSNPLDSSQVTQPSYRDQEYEHNSGDPRYGYSRSRGYFMKSKLQNQYDSTKDVPTEDAFRADEYHRPQINYDAPADSYNRPSYQPYGSDAVPHHMAPSQPYDGWSPFEGAYGYYETAGTSSMNIPSATYEDTAAPSWESPWQSEMRNNLFNSVTRPSSPEHSPPGRAQGEDDHLAMYKHATPYTDYWLDKKNYQIVDNNGNELNCLVIALLQHAKARYKENDLEELNGDARNIREKLKQQYGIKERTMLTADPGRNNSADQYKKLMAILSEHLDRNEYKRIRDKVIIVTPHERGIPYAGGDDNDPFRPMNESEVNDMRDLRVIVYGRDGERHFEAVRNNKKRWF